ncbi:MAG: DUF4124 domain-containing protein [Steroidobacteraceae bacterium]
MRYLPYLVLLIATPLMATNVWKWRDANGVVHFSDQPVAGAEQVSIQSSSTFIAPAVSTERAASSSSSAVTVSYKNVEIWKPSTESTIPNQSGSVSVGVRVEPALATEHRLALYLDGRLVSGFPERGAEYELNDVSRGAHTLDVVVIDMKGTQVTASAPVKFYVQRPTVLR